MTDWQDETVLVTGAAGFVGSCLARDLNARGACVVGLDIREVPEPAVLDPHTEGINFEQVDITDRDAVEDVFQTYAVDTVYHLAAESLVTEAKSAPVETFETNAKGTWTVLDSIRSETVPTERVIVASTDKVYGPTDSLPYTEQTRLTPESPYAVSKMAADRTAYAYHENYGIPVTIARCSNIYGPGDLNRGRIVPDLIGQYLKGERPVIRSDGTPTRDYLFIDDALAAYRMLGERTPSLAGEAFNFGTGVGTSVNELDAFVSAIVGADDITPIVNGEGAREISHQRVNSEKARRELDWRPRTDLLDGLERTVPWYRERIA
jgi:CDP-glucose 4,6-dehydratase